MQRNLLRVVLVLVVGCAAGCAGSERVIRIGGEDAAIRGFILPVKETFEAENGIALQLVQSRPGQELTDLEEGRVDAIISARPLQMLLQEAALERVAVDPASLKQINVGKGSTVIFLHPSNRIKKLTKQQLKSIFTGKIRNWKRLGGVDQEIVVVWLAAPSAQNAQFTREILDGGRVAAKQLPASSYDEVRTRVIATPGSIGIAPQGLIASAVRVPKTPLVEAAVIMVMKGAPPPNVRKLMELLQEAAYIP
jgi:phosphate transport system substrate-binding protein